MEREEDNPAFEFLFKHTKQKPQQQPSPKRKQQRIKSQEEPVAQAAVAEAAASRTALERLIEYAVSVLIPKPLVQESQEAVQSRRDDAQQTAEREAMVDAGLKCQEAKDQRVYGEEQHWGSIVKVENEGVYIAVAPTAPAYYQPHYVNCGVSYEVTAGAGLGLAKLLLILPIACQIQVELWGSSMATMPKQHKKNRKQLTIEEEGEANVDVVLEQLESPVLQHGGDHRFEKDDRVESREFKEWIRSLLRTEEHGDWHN
ncbi:uncharacterized protein BYT42DRAFT_613218 [Radiomyces spectabilis]|uniref:uncharacterized protein n=1 Tax=Radiomyces spectabilis TaxID=64574 RepID=UPI002220E5F6|nr:uncharacterized protein BYT42DRAFT_613218 [Radiomyces spectabilis]KAI8381440.1 hypothetical protein BYT42DRAFT_613218 [Radiomyces spectabilis]